MLFLDRYLDKLVVLDEIHRMPALFEALRGIIDAGRRSGHRTGRFLILGSASIDLLRQSGETLAGRIEYMDLTPCARRSSMTTLHGNGSGYASAFPTAT